MTDLPVPVIVPKGKYTFLLAQDYGESESYRYRHFFCSRLHYTCSDSLPLVLTRLSYDEAGAYWGWWDAKDQMFQFVFPKKMLVDMCFPYGPEAEEQRGRGKVVPLLLEVNLSVKDPILAEPW